jgi:hypothetical protein
MPVAIKTVRAALHGPGKYRVMNTVEGLAEALLYYWPVGKPRHHGRRLRSSEAKQQRTPRARRPSGLGEENAAGEPIEPPSAHYLARAACIAALEVAFGDRPGIHHNVQKPTLPAMETSMDPQHVQATVIGVDV